MRRRRSIFRSDPNASPVINTTPLIDVMLVLLALLIMTVPLATHQTKVDLPQPGGESLANVEAVSLTVDAAGQSYWNGEAVDAASLRQHLIAAAAQAEQPVIRFQPDPQASYDASVHVIAMTGDAGIENLAFIGNDQFGTFGR